MRDLYSNDVATAAVLAAHDAMPEPREYDYDGELLEAHHPEDCPECYGELDTDGFCHRCREFVAPSLDEILADRDV